MESLTNKPKLLVLTNIDSIPNIYQKIESVFDVIYIPDRNFQFLKTLEDNIKDNIYAIFTNPNKSKIQIDSTFLKLFKNIKTVCTASTGTVHIDVDLCKKKNIKIISLKNEIHILEKVSSTAELAFLFLLTSFRNIISASQDVKNGNWDCDNFIGRQMNHLCIGVVGYGRLGKMFAKYVRDFGAKAYVFDPYVESNVIDENLIYTNSLFELCKVSDAISIHVHVNPETKLMVNTKFLDNCKKNVSIINTARGEIINENDLLDFLKINKESKYFTDVISNEISGRSESPIYEEFIKGNMEEQIFITPHIGGMTHDARNIAYNHAAELLINSIKNE